MFNCSKFASNLKRTHYLIVKHQKTEFDDFSKGVCVVVVVVVVVAIVNTQKSILILVNMEIGCVCYSTKTVFHFPNKFKQIQQQQKMDNNLLS